MRIVFFLLLISNVSLSQKEVLLENELLINPNYLDNDSTRIRTYYFSEYPEIKLILNYRENEYFVLSDTLKRDYVLFGSSKTTIDKLQGLQQCDYTGAYDLVECRKVIKNGAEYWILCFVDTFIMGTNQNVFYVILKSDKNNWEYISSYDNEADKPTDNIKVICSKKGLKLKGKYLKQSKQQGFDCLN